MNLDDLKQLPQGDLSCGFVGLIGRPNVGKSTLMNRILGQKVSITSKKPQTTRHKILGIKTSEKSQLIFVDTPGMHKNAKKMINKYMNKTASGALADVDLIVFIVEAGRWHDEDQMVLEKITNVGVPIILVVNKVDLYSNKNELLPYLEKLHSKADFKEVIPVSAEKGVNVAELEDMLVSMLPKSGAFYPEDQITDKTDRFLSAEIVREKLMRNLGQELPYSLTVEIERFKKEEDKLVINAIIWVERDSQKAMVIGKGGQSLKKIGISARRDLERAFEEKVRIELWVKVKDGWSDDKRALQSLGYADSE